MSDKSQQIQAHFREVFGASSFQEILDYHNMVEFCGSESCIMDICETANMRGFRYYLICSAKDADQAVFMMQLKHPHMQIGMVPKEVSILKDTLHFAHFWISRDPENLKQIWPTLVRGGVLSIGGDEPENVKKCANKFLLENFENPPKLKTTSAGYAYIVKGKG